MSEKFDHEALSLAPPQSDVGLDQERTRYTDYPLARRDLRLLNFVIDALIVCAVWYLLKTLLFTLDIDASLYQFTGLGSMAGGVLYGVLLLSYYLFCEAIWCRTIGKMVSGTMVVDRQGKPVSFYQALLRTLVRMIPIEWFSFITQDRPVGWHDEWSNTRVIELDDEV